MFPVQIPMGFEDFPILNIAEGVNGELLPIQVPPSTLIYFFACHGLSSRSPGVIKGPFPMIAKKGIFHRKRGAS